MFKFDKYLKTYLRDRSFFYEGGRGGGGGVVGIWEAPPAQKKITLPQDFTILIFSTVPLLDVIVLTVKTKLTIPILQRALKKTQIKRKRSQTLLFLGHCSLIKNKKQTTVINTLTCTFCD